MTFSLSTSRLHLEFLASDARLRLSRYALADSSWFSETSNLFAVEINGQRFDASNLTLLDFTLDAPTNGVQHGIAHFGGDGFQLDHHVKVYADTALIESWQVLHVTGASRLHITRMDSFSLDLPPAEYDLLHFSSDWGEEFEPVRASLTGEITLETRSGRSSKGQHPYFALVRDDQTVLSGAVAWSGNWIFRFKPLPEGNYRLSGGLHDWNFVHNLPPGASRRTPPVILALGRDLDDTARQFHAIGRQYWYPRNDLSASLPVEWNHWWSYEDADINEAVFLANVESAAQLGIELCTLDAGWFGTNEHWYQLRGDWDHVNTDRFPHGIRAIADAVHAHGMKFGLWCEIEGLGEQAELARTHPEFAAQRDGASLGYVCLGNPQAEAWAFATLSRLIRDYACDWIKLDFNLDPGAGCNRTDHGHGAGDGLYAHYTGYYRLLDRIRAAYPEVVLENCSSGGLRIDLGMLRHTHMTFLSDPDWPAHDLQIFWGATTTLAPDVCLHWGFSEWRVGNGPPQQNFNPRDPNLKPHQLDYYTRIAMLGVFGLSQKLPDLPEWVAQRLAHHIAIYQQHVRRFVREAHLYRLTDQPRRSGDGDRWCAFQYALPDEHLLFVFRLPGAEAQRTIHLKNLLEDRIYQIDDPSGQHFWPQKMLGRDLMEQGLTFDKLQEEDSILLRLRLHDEF